MAVGIDDSKIQNLMTMFIKGKIPNAHLWDAKMSLYDIAELNYRPLMLREHFRCVPDIIGYCNMLSYESSRCAKQAVRPSRRRWFHIASTGREGDAIR